MSIHPKAAVDRPDWNGLEVASAGANVQGQCCAMQRVGLGGQQLVTAQLTWLGVVSRPSGDWDRYSSRTVSTLTPRAWAAAPAN